MNEKRRNHEDFILSLTLIFVFSGILVALLWFQIPQSNADVFKVSIGYLGGVLTFKLLGKSPGDGV